MRALVVPVMAAVIAAVSATAIDPQHAVSLAVPHIHALAKVHASDEAATQLDRDFAAAQRTASAPSSCSDIPLTTRALVSLRCSFTTTPTGVCSSECMNLVRTHYPGEKRACLSSGLASAAWLCDNHPQCYNDESVRLQNSFIACSRNGLIQTLLDMSNTTAAGTAAANAACANSCLSDFKTLATKYPECYRFGSAATRKRTAATLGLINGLCDRAPSGEYCAVAARAPWRFSRCGYSSFVTNATCVARNGTGGWCKWTQTSTSSSTPSGTCVAEYTKARLDGMCNSCLANVARVIDTFSSGFAATVTLPCLRVSRTNRTYCTTIPAVANRNINSQFASPTSLYVASNATLAQRCDGSDVGRCQLRLDASRERLSTSNVQSTCASSSFFCASTARTAAANNARARIAARLTCTRSPTTGTYCVSALRGLMNGASSCTVTSCSRFSSCAFWLSRYNNSLRTGDECCLPHLNALAELRSTSYLQIPNTTAVRISTFHQNNNSETVATTTVALNSAGTYGRYNYTSRWTLCGYNMESRVGNATVCPSTRATARGSVQLKVTWASVLADAALKSTLETSMAADVANAMELPTSDVTGSLEEDTTQSLSRRQGSSGTRFAYTVSTANAAEATAAVAAVDAQVASQTFDAQATQTAAEAGCTGGACGGSANFVAGSVDPVTLPPSAPSSSVARGAALALVAAVLMALF